MSTSSSASSSLSTSLYIFTTSQTPLAVRYPHPRKPTLVLPALLHRTIHTALDADPPSVLQQSPSSTSTSSTFIIPHPENLTKHDLPPHPISNDGPSVSTSAERDASHLSDSELTVKLHLVGAGSPFTRSSWVGEAVSTLSQYKGFDPRAIDTLLLGFKGVDYRGDKTIASQMFGCGSEGLEAPNTETISADVEEQILEVWKRVSHEVTLGEKTRLGTLYSTLGLLKRLVAEVQGGGEKGKKVQVNALDTPDCHHLPKEYTAYARDNDIELWAGGGGEGSDPLPSAHLHNLLQEFSSKIKQIVSEQNSNDDSNGNVNGNVNGNGNGSDQKHEQSGTYSAKLDYLVPVREDGLKFTDEPRGVEVRWVLSYTLLSKTRNVVHDKGYLVAADLVA